MLKSWLISFSLAHLLIVFFFMISTGYGYIFPTDQCIGEIWSFLLFLLITTSIIKGCFRKNFIYLFPLVFFTTLRGIKGFFSFSWGKNGISLLLLTIGISCILFWMISLRKNRQKWTIFFEKVLLFFVPFGIFTVAKLGYSIYMLNQPIIQKTYQVTVKNSKIFWIVFDELDQFLLFTNDGSYRFNEFEKLKNQAIYAPYALQAGNCTNVSLPALTTGISVVDTTLINPFTIELTTRQGKKIDWKKSKNIFQTAYSLGYNSALIGWYHPYDRILGKDLAYVSQEPFLSSKEKQSPTLQDFGTVFCNQIAFFLNYNFGKLSHILGIKNLFPSQWIKKKQTTRCMKWYNSLLKQIDTCIENPNLQLNFFHLPLPHYPTCYDPQTKKIALKKTKYFDNVYLSEKILRYIRQSLEKKNLWDSSTIIVTSDHWLRTEKGFIDEYILQEDASFQKLLEKRKAPYVPFLIKMPFQQSIRQIDTKISSLILHDIVVQIMNSTLETEDQVIQKIFCSFK